MPAFDHRATVTLPLETLNHFTKECDVIHALCDRSGVPAHTEDGEKFSISQRVAILQGVTEGLMKRIGMVPPTDLH
jgi:hypothetical protein